MVALSCRLDWMLRGHQCGGESREVGTRDKAPLNIPADAVAMALHQPLFICTLSLLPPSLPPHPNSTPSLS